MKIILCFYTEEAGNVPEPMKQTYFIPFSDPSTRNVSYDLDEELRHGNLSLSLPLD